MDGPLRGDLLAGRVVAVEGPPDLAGRLGALGASTVLVEPGLDDDALETWAREQPAIDALLYDGRGPFAGGGVRACLDGAWRTVRAVAAGALLATARPAKIVLIAPAHGRFAAAARAALENTARTLSVEWARHAVTTCAVLPGPGTTEAEIATVAAYLSSPAGAYISGCAITLGAVIALS